MKNNDISIKKLDIKKDNRGRLIEIFRAKDVMGGEFGQVLITTAYPGETKGNHYHARKNEWYCVVKGQARLTLISNKTHEKQEFQMGENNMLLVHIPPNYTHFITNIGKEEMFLLVYVDEIFVKSDPDTYPV